LAAPLVLILTHRADHFTVDRVAAALARLGADAVRFDTDRFPAEVRLSAQLGPGGERFVYADGERRVDVADVRAVWARRVWPAALDPALEPRFRDACLRESRAALEGFWNGCAGARWVNPPAADQRAGDKLLQLRLASQHGLAVPRSLLTNDPSEALAFQASLGGSMVAKMLTPLTISMEGGSDFVFTSEVSAEDLRDASGLRHSPMLFQERVPKAIELRVVLVGGRAFTGAIDASGSAAGAVDWRRADPGQVRWSRAELPADRVAALAALTRELGLEYAAVDLILTPAGEYVFLEVNPGGEWGMLERDLDHDISGALAQTLIGS
jgi:hypothetical protein